jgi:hypothetical protein
MTTRGQDDPSRVPVTFQKKQGQIVLDQIRTVDKSRLIRRLGRLDKRTTERVLGVLQEMFAPQQLAPEALGRRPGRDRSGALHRPPGVTGTCSHSIGLNFITKVMISSVVLKKCGAIRIPPVPEA